jgi:hypothetical protein
MSSIIQNKMEKLLGDGARATKFDVLFSFTDGSNAAEVGTLAKATNFPGKKHDIIDLKFKGRSIPIKGQTKYDQTWECTFYLTQDHSLKQAFENWIEALDQKHNYLSDISGVKRLQALHNEAYTTTMKLVQKDFEGSTDTAVYTMLNVFPVGVGEISYSSESVGQIQEFTVTFAYSHFTLETKKAAAGNFIDNIIDKANEFVSSVVDGAINDVADAINGFVSDAVGDSLSKLNDFTSGKGSLGALPNTNAISNQLASGGLSSKYMGDTIEDVVDAESAGSAFGSLESNLSEALSLKDRF